MWRWRYLLGLGLAIQAQKVSTLLPMLPDRVRLIVLDLRMQGAGGRRPVQRIADVVFALTPEQRCALADAKVLPSKDGCEEVCVVCKSKAKALVEAAKKRGEPEAPSEEVPCFLRLTIATHHDSPRLTTTRSGTTGGRGGRPTWQTSKGASRGDTMRRGELALPHHRA